MIPFAFAALASGCDLTTRKIPNALILAALLVGASLPSWSWWGFLVGLALPILAGLPPGDVKAGAVLGGLLGLHAITLGFMPACGAAYLVARWHRRPADLPFFPFIAVPAMIASAFG